MSHNHELHMQQMLMTKTTNGSTTTTKTTTVDPHAHHNHGLMTNTPFSSTVMDHSGHLHGSDAHTAHGMLMYMHGGFGNDYIVFYEWSPKNAGALVASCFALIFIAMFYEALKSFRFSIRNKNFDCKRSKVKKASSLNIAEENKKNEKNDNICSYGLNEIQINNQDDDDEVNRLKSYFRKMLSLDHLIQTLLHVFQFAIGYFIMLSFMTYNYWLCLSILFGIGLGYFLFGVRRDIKNGSSSSSAFNQNFQDCH